MANTKTTGKVFWQSDLSIQSQALNETQYAKVSAVQGSTPITRSLIFIKLEVDK